MLLRDLIQVQRGGGYLYALTHLKNGRSLYCEAAQKEGPFTMWVVPGHVTQPQATNPSEDDVVVLRDGDEFEAQAVLDHYLQNYSLDETHG